MKQATTPGSSPDTNPALAPIDKGEARPAGGVFRLDAAGAAGESAPPPAPKARLSLQTVMLACLLVGGAGLLYAMRLVGINPLQNVAGGTKLNDYELARPGSMTADHKRVLEQLSTATAAPAQVPADQVHKNPFELADLLGPATPALDAGAAGAKAGAERARRDAEARARKLQTTLAGLKLNGVLGGSRPVARISGKAVRVGDTVEDLFTVHAIHGRSVELTADGRTFTLTMDDATANVRDR
jgi:hypothetical protein